MKVFIVGVSGGTGARLAQQLKARGDEVGGLYRKPQQGTALRAFGVSATLGDLVSWDAGLLAEAMRGNDVLVFTAGAGDADGDAMTDAIDGDGVTKSIAAARLAQINRFFLVSVFPDAWRDRHMGESFEHYMRVKKRTEVELARTELDWVIVRPSALIDAPGAGKISLGLAEFHTEVPRDDVAATLAELIHTPMIRRTILELTQGDTVVAAAVAAQVPRGIAP